MTQPRVVQLESLESLRAAAEAWDDLWRRSNATLPSLRAEMLAQWVEQFSRPDCFRAIVVEADGRFLAALPLVRRKVATILTAGAMPGNEWSASGDLLLDESSEATAPVAVVLKTLAGAIRQGPWPLLWLDEAVLDAPRWLAFKRAAADAGMTVATHPRWQVGRVDIDHNWPAYMAHWSRKHRQKMANAGRRLLARGEVRLVLHSDLSPGEAAEAMRECFAIEDRGWKGAAGTSVLKSPGMADFLTRQAELAAAWGQLEVAFLLCNERAVAFSYGLTAKGVFHSIKVSYDPDFGGEHVGQLLRRMMLERFFAEPDRAALDFQGEMTEAHAAWQPTRYTVGRLAIAPRGWCSRLAVRAYGDLWPRLRGSRC